MNISPNLHHDPTSSPANDQFFFNFIDQKVFELIWRGNGPYAEWFLNVDEDCRAAANILEGQVLDGMRKVMRRSTVIAAICECILIEEPQIAEEDVPMIECYVTFTTATAMSWQVWLVPVSSPIPSQPNLTLQTLPASGVLLFRNGGFHTPHTLSLYIEIGGPQTQGDPSTPCTQTPVRWTIAMHLGTDSPSVILAHSSGSSDVFLNPDTDNVPIPCLFQCHAKEPDF